MYVRILGAAAGGGFPQWNCACHNCRRLRQGSFPGTARSQAQLAVTADRQHWFLINASPDLRYQIESFPPLHPRPPLVRDSPIQGIILTSAELDAALGLLLLRESQPLLVYATAEVRALLLEDNNVFEVLRRQPDQVRWKLLDPGKSSELESLDGRPTGMRVHPMSMKASFPGHIAPSRAVQLDSEGAVVGLFVEHLSRRLAFFPGAKAIVPDWLADVAGCDALLFDGTFWSDTELIRLQGGGKTAREMGHLPIGDPGGTLDQLASLRGPRKIFVHINNTNPVLDEASPEYARVRAAGWELGFDGMEFSL